MKRFFMPLLLFVSSLAMVAAAWATPAAGPADKEKSGEISCPALKPKGMVPHPKDPGCGRTTPTVWVKEKEGWKLVVHILQPGTRSQGYHGILYKDGQRIEGEKGESRETPWGTFSWQGSMNERVNLWNSTGWVCEEGNPVEAEIMPRPTPQPSREELDKELEDMLEATE